MAKRFRAAFQSLIGIDHYLLILFGAMKNSLITASPVGNELRVVDNFARAHIDRFDRVGRVNHLSGLRRVVEERFHLSSVAPPALVDRGDSQKSGMRGTSGEIKLPQFLSMSASISFYLAFSNLKCNTLGFVAVRGRWRTNGSISRTAYAASE
jgi:hypothetical protein